MNKTILIGSLIILICSCSKTDNRKDDILKCDCSHSSSILDPVSCYGTICQSDTCQTYFAIWKELFLSKNQMDQQFFNEHITLCSTALHKWNDGISFEIYYKAKIDWAEDRLSDKFIIWLSPTTSGLYPTLYVPRNVLLSNNQIITILDGDAFSSRIYNVTPIENLKYSSLQEAMEALILASKVDTLCTRYIYFQQPSPDSIPTGHPILESSATLNWSENRCITSTIDLVTGEVKVNFNVCIIWFCLTKGTQISMSEVLTKPIEKIKKGDRIVSVNLKTMSIEDDIVQKIDSNFHDKTVTIEFDDMTLNVNTHDHPYYVKNKGWSSYKPKETMQKYNLKTAQLNIGDTCYKYLGNRLIEIQIKSFSENSRNILTYNLTQLKKNNNFFANGILVSNEDN